METGSMWRRSKQRSFGPMVAVAMVGVLVVAGPACSNDDPNESSSTTLDVNVDPPNDPPATTTVSATSAPDGASPDSTSTDGTSTDGTSTDGTSTDGTSSTEPAQTTTTEAVSGEPFGGGIDGQVGGVDIAFTKADGAIRNFEVRDLEIQCLPLAGGEATTRTIDVVLDQVPVGADGMVDYADEDADFAPQLSGSFADDGRFVGGLYLSQELGGAVCGGEFTFELGD